MSQSVDLYLMTLAGLVKAHANGDGTAQIVGLTLDPEDVREVVADPFKPHRLYAATFTDIYMSDNDGESWQIRPAGGLLYREICSLAAHPTREGELYVGTAPAAVFVSEDAGFSFRELEGLRDLPDYARWTFPPPPHLPRVRRIGLDARKPDEVIVGIEEGGVARSRDRGETWEDISGPVSEVTYGAPSMNRERPGYPAGVEEEGVVYRDVHEFVYDPTDANRIYATTGRGTFRTDDAGSSWRMLDYGMSSKTRYAMPIAIDKQHPERLYVGFASHGGPTAWKGYRPARTGLYWTSRYSRDTSDVDGGAGSVLLRTNDGGETWNALSNGLPAEHAFMICGIQVDPRDSDCLYVAYTDGSVYRTQDGGESWSQVLAGVDKLVGLRIKSIRRRRVTTTQEPNKTEDTTEAIPRYLSSYRARRAYREEIQVPPFVKGVEDTIDIHCHASEGQQDPLALAKLASQAGMGGLLYKSIEGGGRKAAQRVRDLLVELEPWCEKADVKPIKAWAGFGIARGAGIASPQEVKQQIEDGIVCIWMPIANSATTLHKIGGWTSMWDKEAPRRVHSDPLPWDFSVKVGMYTLDDHGKLKPDVKEIFRIIADTGVAVSFAHASHAEIYAMADEVSRLGIKRAFVDHPFSPFVDLSIEQMRELTNAGIYMNFTYDELSPLLGIDPAHMAHTIKALGTSKVTISTDAGEPLFPNSVECMRLIRSHLRAFGVSEDQIHEMSITNPAKIVGLAEA